MSKHVFEKLPNTLPSFLQSGHLSFPTWVRENRDSLGVSSVSRNGPHVGSLVLGVLGMLIFRGCRKFTSCFPQNCPFTALTHVGGWGGFFISCVIFQGCWQRNQSQRIFSHPDRFQDTFEPLNQSSFRKRKIQSRFGRIVGGGTAGKVHCGQIEAESKVQVGTAHQ